jgi:excisionase family DNA binding protein
MEDILGTKLFTTKEAMELLGIGRNKIYELISQCKIEYINLAGKYRITEKGLRDFLVSNTVSPERPTLYARKK